MAQQEESPFKGLITSWPALAALSVTVLSFLVASPRLESPRPAGGAAAPKLRLRVPEVPVRLWQDPLGSVIQGPEQVDSKWFSNNMPKAQGKETKNVLVLLALVESDPNSEQAETRRRERYAILSALNTAGYVPVQSERMSYVDLEHPPDKGATTKRSFAPGQGTNTFSQLKPGDKPVAPVKKEPSKDESPKTEEPYRIRLPFEWARPLDKFERLEKPERGDPIYRGVCVVWVYEDIYLANSLHWLMYLKKNIQESLHAKDKEAGYDFAITGRIVSGRLKTILQDDHDFKANEGPKDEFQDIPLFVTNSTAKSVRDLYKTIVKDKPHPALPHSKLRPHFVIGSDDLLLKRLVKELRNRRIDPASDQIAVIAEWDTGYGRDMHREFLEAANLGKQKPANVHLYSYLRGIDGKLPVKAESAAGEEEKPAKNAKPAETPSDKPGASDAEGDAQLDYLRRLVRQMRGQHKTFRAIGILGSDPYDKLLILKALRVTFPETLFFTTDLDVRLLQPAESEWTRNLVIASHFGLTLREELQDKIPPFRSSYDTASYLGCLLAVRYPLVQKTDPLLRDLGGIDAADHKLAIVEEEKGVPAPVRLYELGRYGAFELTMHDEKADPLGARNLQRDKEYHDSHRWRLFVIVLVIVVIGVMPLAVSRSWQRLFQLQPINEAKKGAAPPFPWRVPLFVAALLISASLAGLILYAHFEPDQEPFSMVEGISIWPTVIFRVFAILLCAYYLCKMLEDLTLRNTKVSNEFFRPEGEPARQIERVGLSACLHAFPDTFRAGVGMWLWNPDPEKTKVEEAWRQFEQYGSLGPRFCRYLVLLVANLLLFMLLWSLFEPVRFHGRGSMGPWVARITLDIAGIALVSLLIYVVDTTVLCYRFVTFLSRHTGKWPDALVKSHCDGRSLPVTEPVCAALNQLLAMRLIATTTRAVSRLIFDPFVVLFVLIVAQSPLFVTWQWYVPALAVGAVCAGAALGCAFILQRSGKEAQSKALEKLDELLLPNTEEVTRRKLQLIRTEIEEMDSGVFAGVLQNPVLYALLLPFAGGGGLAALEALLPHL